MSASANHDKRDGWYSQSAAKTHRCHGGRPTMIHDVVSAIYKGEYKIEATFDDGKKGVVAFQKYLD